MKKLMFAIVASAAFFTYADEAKTEAKDAPKTAPAELEETDDAPLFWGFGNYGLYSGYQLYGSLLNNEPTLQGYLEGNMNLSWDDLDLGYFGLGIWSNTDLTPRRNDSLGGAFNEWDFNAHWGRTFWFDDDRTWGLGYRMSFVWYYYPGENYRHIHPATATTFDWNHYVELTNPYLIPYVNCVHEYLQSNGNLFQFGVKKPFQVTDKLSLCPYVEMVARDGNYNWCFPTRFGGLETCGGLATLKVELDATYQITENFGIFAKVAYCSIIDHHLRNNCDDHLDSSEYGENKDFVWGGVGVTLNF